MSGKREQVREFIERHVLGCLAEVVADMGNRDHAEAIRSNRRHISQQISWRIWQEYVFLELADIMEWKRTRVRR